MQKSLFIVMLILTLSDSFSLIAQNVIISEFVSTNYDLILDFEGDDSDWIEIYNNSEDTINLSDYYLTDNPSKLDQWKFPEFQMMPYSFLIVFASGKDTVILDDYEIHTNFLLNAWGENLIISKKYQLLFEYQPVKLKQNQSFGVSPDDITETMIFEVPTPGMANQLIELEKVEFSQSGGFYENVFTLELSNTNSQYDIYFTIDGNTPDTNSFKYENGLLLDEDLVSPIDIYKIKITTDELYYIPDDMLPKAIVIRAATFDSLGNIKSSVYTNSYLISELGVPKFDLPVMFISADYFDLFDETNGIFVPGVHFVPDSSDWTGNYYQRGIEWEREVSLEMYLPDNQLVFEENLGLRTHGGNVRRMTQKGMRFYARGEYGAKKINEKLLNLL